MPDSVQTGAANGPVKYAGWTITLLIVLNVLNIIDRNLIASFAPQITRDLGLSDVQYGLLTGLVFVFFYAVMGLVVGRLADKVNRPKLIAAGLLLWSALTMVSGATKNFVQIAFDDDGNSVVTPFLPIRDALVQRAFGIENLTPETSFDIALGLTSKVNNNFSITHPPKQ